MAAEVLFTGPQPGSGKRFCMVCSYTFKGAVIERFAEQIEAAAKLPDGSKPVLLDALELTDLPPLYEAVAMGLFAPLAQLGAIELCWSHLNAVTLRSAGGLHLPVPGQGMMGAPGMNGRG
jgi:hypothetical protein